MKKLTLKSSLMNLALAMLVLVFTVSSCDENPEVVSQNQILPESFGVEIPQSINSATINTGGREEGTEDLSGGSIYSHLRLFIHIGAASKDLVEGIMLAIKEFNIESLQSITYQSDDDGRTKQLDVFQNVDYEGQTWEYQLTVTDLDAQGDADGGVAMQVFWSNDPVVGIAILKPYNINRDDREQQTDAMYRIDYNSAGDDTYDATMEVSISGLRTDLDEGDEFAMRNLRMYVGKSGDNVDVFGNSNHPKAYLFGESTDPGFNWAFVASGNEATDLGVAEIGLPPSALDSDSREVLLEDYSVKSVFSESILREYPNATQDQIDALLINTNAPGYFNKMGFVSAGLSPGDGWNELADRIELLSPYNPFETTNLSVEFKQ